MPQSMPPSRTLGALLEHLAQLGVHREAVGDVDEGVADAVEHLGADRRVGRGVRRVGVAGLGSRRLQAGVALDVGAGVARVGGLLLGLLERRLGLDEDPLQLLLVVAQRGLGVLDGDVATTDERLGVELADAALGLDEVVHQRLRHRRVVALVVAATAVADHVDDDVLVELLAELVGQLGDPHAGLRVVAVDVEDRRLDHPGDVGGVRRGARAARRRREADLVVDDDVHGAAGAVAAQLREVERLGDDPLAGERRVAVHEHGQDGEVLAGEVEAVLLGPHDALEHGVDGLEVRRVRGEVDLGRLAALRA